jgi:purine-cytosine permease-like protein
VPEGDRHGKAVDLLWLWLAADLGIVGVVYGAVIATLGLDLVQAAAVAVVGTTGSFLVVGVLGIAGQRRGAPMLALSRRPFGRSGNVGPSLVSWLSLLGWETVTAVVAADVCLAVSPSLAHGSAGRWPAIAALATVTGLSLVLGRLGHATIVVVQRVVAWIFGCATLAMAAYLAVHADWAGAAAAHPAPFGALVAGVSIVAASAGVSWVNVSADYTRYLPKGERPVAVAGWTVLGGSLPLVALVVLGYVLSTSVPGLVTSSDPIGALQSALPGWVADPYLVVAVVGLLAQMVMGLYSSGLNLMVLGVRVRRSRTVLVDALVILVAGGWIMVGDHHVLGSFESFVELLACPIATWASVFLVDMAIGRSRPSAATQRIAVCSWAAGTVVGLLLTTSPLYTGPLARGVFARSRLGYFAGSLAAAGLFAAGLFAAGTWAARPPAARPPAAGRGEAR